MSTPTILGVSQRCDGFPKRFKTHLSAPRGGVMQMLLNQEGDWVSFDDYEWLRNYTARQLEQHIKENSQLRLDNAMLKARLEMLESAILSGNAITPDAQSHE